MTGRTAIDAATANLLTAILCGLTAVWTRVTGEPAWMTVLLVILGLAGLVTAGLILRGEARIDQRHRRREREAS